LQYYQYYTSIVHQENSFIHLSSNLLHLSTIYNL